MPTPDFDNKIVYLPVDICQELYNAPGMLTSMAITVKDNDDREIDRMIGSLGSKIEPPLQDNRMAGNEQTYDKPDGC